MLSLFDVEVTAPGFSVGVFAALVCCVLSIVCFFPRIKIFVMTMSAALRQRRESRPYNVGFAQQRHVRTTASDCRGPCQQG